VHNSPALDGSFHARTLSMQYWDRNTQWNNVKSLPGTATYTSIVLSHSKLARNGLVNKVEFLGIIPQKW